MSVDWDKVDEAALALMYLTTFSERDGTARTWKGFDWEILNRMFERGWISDPRTKAKSVVMFDAAQRKSRTLFEERFGTFEQSDSSTRAAAAGSATTRCECGCGTVTRGHTFVPGHDQKLRIQLEQRVGGLLALRDLIDKLEQHSGEEQPQD